MSNYPDDMNNDYLEEKTNPRVEEAEANIYQFSLRISEAVDAALASLRGNCFAAMNEEADEIFELLSEKYLFHIEDELRILREEEVYDEMESCRYIAPSPRRLVPTNPATYAAKGEDL